MTAVERGTGAVADLIEYARAVAAARAAEANLAARLRAQAEDAGCLVIDGGQVGVFAEDGTCEEHCYVEATGETIFRGRVASPEDLEAVLDAYEAKIGKELVHVDALDEAAHDSLIDAAGWPDPPASVPAFIATAIGEAEPDELWVWLYAVDGAE